MMRARATHDQALNPSSMLFSPNQEVTPMRVSRRMRSTPWTETPSCPWLAS